VGHDADVSYLFYFDLFHVCVFFLMASQKVRQGVWVYTHDAIDNPPGLRGTVRKQCEMSTFLRFFL